MGADGWGALGADGTVAGATSAGGGPVAFAPAERVVTALRMSSALARSDCTVHAAEICPLLES